MTDKVDRSERLQRRLQDGTEKNAKTSVKDKPGVLMYLPEDLHEELDLTFDEMNLNHKREHGGELGKSRDFYPTLSAPH